MTMALCLNCGSLKYGAFCPCAKCRSSTSGDVELDITFSDHHYSIFTLQEFSKVVEAIHAATDDSKMRFLTFAHYLSTHHPEIFQASLNRKMKAEAEKILRKLNIPPVKLRDPGDPK